MPIRKLVTADGNWEQHEISEERADRMMQQRAMQPYGATRLTREQILKHFSRCANDFAE